MGIKAKKAKSKYGTRRIYFIGSPDIYRFGGFVYIGSTRSIDGLLRRLCEANPTYLEVLTLRTATSKTERELRELLQGQHVRGNWYRVAGKVLTLLDDLARADDEAYIENEARLNAGQTRLAKAA